MVRVQVAVFAERVGDAQVLLWLVGAGDTEVVMAALSRWVEAGTTDAVMVKTCCVPTPLVAVCGVTAMEASRMVSGLGPNPP